MNNMQAFYQQFSSVKTADRKVSQYWHRLASLAQSSLSQVRAVKSGVDWNVWSTESD